MLEPTQPGGDPGGTGEPAAGTPKPWLEQVPESHRGHEALSPFNGVGDLASAFIEQGGKLSALEGEGRIKIPGEDATAEDKAAFNKALGVPDSAEGYELRKPETLPEGMSYSTELEAAYKAKAFELGLPPGQTAALYDFYNQIIMDTHNQKAKQDQESLAAAETTLKKEWGESYDGNLERVKRVMGKFGGEEFTAFLNTSGLGDNPAMAKMMLEFSKVISDDLFMEGTPAGGGPLSEQDKADKMFGKSMPKK
jgi:hypothetical protein